MRKRRRNRGVERPARAVSMARKTTATAAEGGSTGVEMITAAEAGMLKAAASSTTDTTETSLGAGSAHPNAKA